MAGLKEINSIQALIAIIVVGLVILAGIWTMKGDDDEKTPINKAPTVELISPANGTTLSTTTPLLVWNGSDPDGDELSYNFILVSDGTAYTGWKTTNTTNYKASNLTPGTSYYWQVEVSDGELSDTSEIFTFDIEKPPTNKAPTVELISPLNNTTLNSTTPLMVWNGSDPDGNPLVYQVKMTQAGEELSVQHITNSTSWRATGLIPGISYNWQVEVNDGEKLNTSELFALHIERPNHPPSVELLSPLNDALLSSTSPLLVWNGSDPEGDHLVYQIKMAQVGEGLSILHTTNTTSWRATNLTPGNSYNWCVNVTDGEASNTSELFTFHIDYTERAIEIMAGMNLSQKVGQVMVGKTYFTDSIPADVVNLTLEGKVGGWLIGFYQGTDREGLLNLSNDLQGFAQEATSIPLFMMADFEGGWWNPFSSINSQWPNPMTLGAANDTELAYQFGRGYGTEMAALGFNMALAPVLDVNTNPDNPVIAARSFGSDPELVTRLGLKVIAGNEDAGIISTAKHFPGHGDTKTDSHTKLPTLNFTRERVYSIELKPFKAAIDEGVPVIMTAHIAIPVLDNGSIPATLSKPILTGIMREEFGFDGLIITDAMNMGGITTYMEQNNITREEAALLAFNAGVDIILWASEQEMMFNFHEFFMEALGNGTLTEDRVNESVLRILKAKLEYGLLERYPAGSENLSKIRSKDHEDVVREIANNSIVLFNNQEDVLPLELLIDEPILVVSPNNLLLENGNLSLAYYLTGRGYNVTPMKNWLQTP